MVEGLPLHTSASQLVTYSMCGRKYYFSYIAQREPEYRSTALILGSAVGSAIGFWFERRLAGVTATMAEVDDVLAADLMAASMGPRVRWKGSSAAALEEEGRKYVHLYLASNGDLPVVAVEEPFDIELVDPETGEVHARRLRGYFDLRLADGRAVELKTSARAWTDGDLHRHLQVGAYMHVLGNENMPPALDVHVIVKLKKLPRVDVFAVRPVSDQHLWWLSAALLTCPPSLHHGFCETVRQSDSLKS